MAGGYPIAEGELEINADPSEALRNVQEFLRQVDRRLHRAEDDAEDSGRRSGRRFGDGLTEGLRGAMGGNLITDLITPNGGGGGGGGGGEGGGGGFIQGIVNGFSSGFRRVIDEIRTLISEIETMLSGLTGGGGGGFLSDLRDDLNDLIADIRGGFTSVITYLHSVWTRTIATLGGPAIAGLWTRFIAWIQLSWTRFSAWASSSFTMLWTRIRTFYSSMTSGARVLWTRFSTWAIASLRTLGILGSSFWTRFSSWARSSFARFHAWSSAWISAFGIMGRWLFGRLRSWGSGVWTRMSARGRSMWTRIASWGRSAITSIGGWFGSLFSSLGTWVSTFGSQLSSAFSKISGVAGQLGPVLQIAGYAALVPVILSLGGAIMNLLPLLFLLPAGIATLLGILAPAIVGFKGLGAAIGAGLSGDMEKLNEAMKKLTPSARAFVKEFITLGPALKNIKKQTQEALFRPLLGAIKPLAFTLLPALATGMAKSAAVLGRFLAGLAKMAGSTEVISAINALFETSGRVLDRLGAPIANLFGAMFGTIEGGLPWIERLSIMLGDAIDKFANWLRLVKGNGDMQRWLETAWSTAGDLWEVLKQLGLVVKNLFADTGDEGTTFLQGLANSLANINKWLTSKEGKDFIDVLASSIAGLIVIFDALAWVIGFTIKGLLGIKDAGIVTWNWLKSAWSWLSNAFAATVDWITMAAGISWDWLVNAGKAVGDFFAGIGKWFSDAYDTVIEWGGKIVDWFAALPGVIGRFFASIPGWIASGLAAVRDAVSYGIGYVAGLIVKTFMDLPGAIAQAWAWITRAVAAGASAAWGAVTGFAANVWNSLVKLGSDMLNAVTGAWDSMFKSTSKGVSDTWGEVQTLPGKAGDALSSLPGKIGDWISSAWSRGYANTVKGVSDTVSEVGKLGGKIGNALAGAGTWLYEVGRDIIRGLVNGISDMWGWAVEQAKAAANAIKRGFLDALDSHSPSRVMDREVGRTILPGVMQGIDHDLPQMERYLGAVSDLIVNGFQPVVNVAAPNVHTGDTYMNADFGEGIKQVVPLVITRIPRVVAGAADVGRRVRTGWVNTGRKATR